MVFIFPYTTLSNFSLYFLVNAYVYFNHVFPELVEKIPSIW